MKVLLVDDKLEMRTQVLDTWPKAGIQVRLSEDRGSAFGNLAQDKFDCVLVDLQLGHDKKGEFSGIPLAAAIRQSQPDVLMVLYSAFIENGDEASFGQYKHCIDAGADHVVARTWITNTPATTIAKILAEWRQKRLDGHRSLIELKTSHDLSTKAAIERLGGDGILKDILRSVLPDQRRFEVEAISGGYSGALLFRVRSASQGGDRDFHHNVVKAATSVFSLQEELKARPYQGSVLDSVAVAARGNSVVQVDRWYALCIPEVLDSVTLERFVLSRKESSKTKSVLRAVVADCLTKPAQASRRTRGEDHADGIRMRYVFLAEVQNALVETRAYSEQFLTREYADACRRLEGFLAGIEEGFFGIGADNLQVAQLHGDFHCRNVLIRQGRGGAVVIDFGRSDLYPRLFDFANLDVDLMVRVLDSEQSLHWDWRRVDEWWDVVCTGFPLASDHTGGGSVVQFLRSTLHGAVSGEIERVTPREYAEGLIFQLLRYLRFESITISKKALAARWAAELIRLVGMHG